MVPLDARGSCRSEKYFSDGRRRTVRRRRAPASVQRPRAPMTNFDLALRENHASERYAVSLSERVVGRRCDCIYWMCPPVAV
jgi:hypothetical protein